MAIEPTLESTVLDRSEESSTTALYRAAIGPMGAPYYLPLFARFEAADRAGIGWNWAASLTTLNWLAYRQLWSVALAYAGGAVGLALLVFGIGRLVFRFSEPVEWALLAAYLAILFVLPGLFANALLHAECRRRMAKALAANTTLPEACAMLARQASSKARLLTLAALNALSLALVVGAYLNFPVVGSLPADTMATLNRVDPLNTKPLPVTQAVAASAAASSPATSASVPVAAVSMAAVASAPVATVSAAAVASAPARAPSATAPASARSASAPVAAASLPAQKLAKTTAPASNAKLAPTVTTPPHAANAASALTKPATRLATGAVQTDLARRATPARAAASAVVASPEELQRVYRADPPASAASAASAPVEAASAAKPMASGASRSATPVPATPVTRASARPAKLASKPASASSAADGSQLINVGLFAQDSNATNALAKLKEAGLPAYTQVIHGKKGKLTRVRVGPYANRADADAAAEKIRALGLDALVAPQ